MANYPALQQFHGTTMFPRPHIRERFASNGGLRLRAKTSQVKYDITIRHDFLTYAERGTLIAFYNANRTTEFTFIAAEDGIPRQCVFAGSRPLEIDPIPGIPSRYRATVRLREE